MKTWLINDKLEAEKGILLLQIMDFKGYIIWQDSKEIEANLNSNEVKYELDLNSIQFNQRETVLVSKFNNKTSYFYFVKPKYLKLFQEEIQKKITQNKDGFSIELSSETLQKDVFLHTKVKGHFLDNFFNLLPNETVTIQFKTKEKELNDLRLKSFNTFIR